MTDEKTNEVTIVKENLPLPVDLTLSSLYEDAGLGTENVKNTDLQTPIISILQSNSPQCKRSDGKYIPNAREGALYNNVTNELYNLDDQGIYVLPCVFEKVFIEWKPNRGGLVAIHDVETPLRNQTKEIITEDGKKLQQLPNQNILVETNQHYVLIIKPDGSFQPAVISMSSTALKASKIWNTIICNKVLETPDKIKFKAPSFAVQYLIKTIAKQKDQYSWFGWSIEPAGTVPSLTLYNAAKAFHEAVSLGKVKVKNEEVDDYVNVTDTDDSQKESTIQY